MSEKETEKPASNSKDADFKYQEGERVLCFHGPLIYEAKCLKLRKSVDGVNEYYIHYAGWNKSWDEWTTDTRILKYNEQNLLRQKELKEAHKDAKRIKGKLAAAVCLKNDEFVPSANSSAGSDADSANNDDATDRKVNSVSNANQDASSDAGSSTVSKKKKRSNPDVETEEHFNAKIEIRVKMPDDLKPWLADDWELICRQRKLVHLPANPTVDEILDNYLKHKTSKNSSNAHREKETAALQITKGLKEYFNVTLGSQLLYKYERNQYWDILQSRPNTPMSSIYGAIHLLRLFVILGGLLVYTPIDERTVQILQTNLHDFLKGIYNRNSGVCSVLI